MSRVAVAALLFARVSDATVPIDGNPTCKCTGQISTEVPRETCDYQFGSLGVTECVKVDDSYGDNNWKLYTAQYGEYCLAWPDPAWSECYNMTDRQVPEQNQVDQNSWCLNPWCYIDPCKCDAPDMVASSAFESHNLGEIFYSYAACGSQDLWTTDNTDKAIGSASCEVETSGAPPSWMPALALATTTLKVFM